MNAYIHVWVRCLDNQVTDIFIFETPTTTRKSCAVSSQLITLEAVSRRLDLLCKTRLLQLLCGDVVSQYQLVHQLYNISWTIDTEKHHAGSEAVRVFG